MRQMLVSALVLFVTMLGVGPALAHETVYRHDHFIVPGERIGPLQVGMASAHAKIVLRSMGDYEQMGPTTWCSGGWDGTCVGEAWRFGDDATLTRTPGRVLWVGTVSFVWKTREGGGVGDDPLKFYSRYGPSTWTDRVWDEWWYRGLAVKTVWAFFFFPYVSVVVVFAPQSDRMPEYPVERD